MGKQPGQDLLPLSNKGVFVGLPPAQHPFSPILLSIQALEPCFRIGDTPLLRRFTRCTIVHGKNQVQGRRDG